MTILWNTDPQGTPEWAAARRAVITGSRAKDARDFKTPTKADLAAGKQRGDSTAKRTLYAMDVARERVGGRTATVFANAAMRLGAEQEGAARVAYEDRSGFMVQEMGFAYTEDRKFGCSVDGLILRPDSFLRPRVWECKTMVSSDTLFKAVVEGDISEYADQCMFNTWLLGADGCVLTLHVWDLPSLTRDIWIPRDEAAIERLEADMLAFEELVTSYETILLAKMVGGARSTPPWDHAPASAPPSPKSPARVPDPSF